MAHNASLRLSQDDLSMLREALEARQQMHSEQVDSLTDGLLAKRKDAIQARKESGIEEAWLRAEEAYAGIDDANRGEFAGARWIKALSINAPLTAETGRNRDSTQSTVFVPITARYVDASSARIAEIILPIDGKSFSFSATPVAELIKSVSNKPSKPKQPNQQQQQGQPQGQTAPPAEDVAPSVEEVAKELQILADEDASRAEKRVFDWMVESGYQAEARKVIDDAARIGVGIFKGPIPVEKCYIANTEVGGEMVKAIIPGSVWCDPWNVYPDPACGEDIRNAAWVWEEDKLSEKSLLDLKGQPGYLSDKIDLAIQRGPKFSASDDSQDSQRRPGDNKHRYSVWYFHGLAKHEDLVATCAPGIDEMGEDQSHKYATFTIVNDLVIRAVISPSQKTHPYNSMSWRRRAGLWAGVGVAESIDASQRIVNAATRRMLTNAGMSSGVQIVIDRGAIYPADGSWTITPDKIWFKREDSTIPDVRAAFTIAEVPAAQAELSAIIQYGMRLAEESAGLPLVAQGQTGESTPNTYGAAALQNNNANTLLRSIGRRFDDCITEPKARAYYEWLLLDPDVPDNEKGDITINAQGSSALVERSIQEQSISQMGALVGNPQFRIDPAKWFEEMCRSKFINPSRLQYSDAEWEKVQAGMQPQPPVQVAVAQIREQGQTQRMQMEIQASQAEKTADIKAGQLLQSNELQANQQSDLLSAQTAKEGFAAEQDRHVMLTQAESQRNQIQYIARLEELKLERELAVMKYANEQKITLDEAKTKLADTAMRLNVEKELASAANMIDLNQRGQTMQPPVQIPGRARDGHAFDQT